MTQPIKVNNSTHNFQLLENNLTLGERLYRYTVGRISCLARALIYALGTCFLTSLTILKFFAAFLVTPLNFCLRDPCLDSWTFSGMVKEATVALHLFDKTLNSIVCFIFAPPQDYYRFEEALMHTIEMSFPYPSLPKIRYPLLSIIENTRLVDSNGFLVCAG